MIALDPVAARATRHAPCGASVGVARALVLDTRQRLDANERQSFAARAIFEVKAVVAHAHLVAEDACSTTTCLIIVLIGVTGLIAMHHQIGLGVADRFVLNKHAALERQRVHE